MADEAEIDRMPVGEQERLCVGDIVERDIDGAWFPAEVSAGLERESRDVLNKCICFV